MKKMHSCPKHFGNGTSTKKFSLCRNLCRLLPVNGKSVLFSYAVPGWLFKSTNFPLWSLPPATRVLFKIQSWPVTSCLRGCLSVPSTRNFYCSSTHLDLSVTNPFFLETFHDSSNCTLKVLCSFPTQHTSRCAMLCFLVYVIICIMFFAHYTENTVFCLFFPPSSSVPVTVSETQQAGSIHANA